MKTFAFLSLIALLFSCDSKESYNPNVLIIENVNIIDVQDGSIEKNQYIVVDSSKIIQISSTLNNLEKYSNRINGKGKFVMPGLAEMHAHIPPPSTSEERIEETLFLYLSNGVTTIRGMLGDSTHLLLRQKSESGEILAPRIYTSSPSLNGNSVKTKEEARQKVSKYKADGYDFLKIHPGIERAVFDEVVKTANEVGINFSGHVPVDVGIRHALKSKYASIDHIDGFIEGLVPESNNIKADENGFFGYNFAPLADKRLIPELVQLSKENEVWIVPTQSLFERWFSPLTAKELLEQEEMKYMPSSVRRNWLRIKNQYMEDESFTEEQWKVFDDLRRTLLKTLQEDGHGILLGSDAPQLFNVPGFSIHHEIQGMKNAGLSNFEIIQSGTINPAKFFNASEEYGQIKIGFHADMLILERNPLEDIKALKEVIGVVRNGNWIGKKEIDKKLESIAKNADSN